MPLAVHCDRCDKSYVVLEEFAGSKARCSCGRVHTVPEDGPTVSPPRSGLDSPLLVACALVMLLLSLLTAGGVTAWVVLDRRAAAQAFAALEKGPSFEIPTPPPPPKKEEEKTKEVKPPQTPDPAPETTLKTFNQRQLHERLLHSVVWIYGEDNDGAWTGSGSVVHVGQRLIVTNAHVVQRQAQMTVFFPKWDSRGDLISEKKYYEQLLKDGKGLKGRVLHRDVARDLAVIQLEDNLPPNTVALKIAPRAVKQAESIMIVGNPGVSHALWVPTIGSVRSRVSNVLVKVPVLDPRTGQEVLVDGVNYPHWCVETQLGTHSGDSGSPVVNEQCQLVAVHFARHPDKTATLKYAADREEVLEVLHRVKIRDEEVLASDTLTPSTGAVEAIIKQIEAPEKEGCSKGIDALGKLDPAEARRAIPAVVRALVRYEDEDFRRRIVEELTRIGPPVKDDINELGPAMKLRYKPARAYVVEALKQMGTDAKEGVSLLVEGLKDKENADLRTKSASIIRDLGEKARPLAFQALLTSTDDEDDDVAKGVFEALCELGKLTPGEIDLLLEALGNPKRKIYVRRYAALHLGKQGAEAVKGVPTLTKILQTEKDPLLLILTAQAVQGIGEKNKEAMEALRQVATSHADEKVRATALDAVVGLDSATLSTRQLMEQVTREKSTDVQKLLTRVLNERLQGLQPEQMGELKPLLEHADSSWNLQALQLIIDKKAGSVVAPEIVALVKHSDAKVFRKALDTLQTLGPDARAVAPALVALIKDIPRTNRLTVALTIASLETKDEKILGGMLPHLVEGLRPSNIKEHGEESRRRIHKALAAIGQPGINAIFKTFDTLDYRGPENIDFRTNMFKALESLGKDYRSEENYAKVKELRDKDLKNPYRDLNSAAQKALAAMDPK